VVNQAANDAVTTALHFRRHDFYRGSPQVGQQLLDAVVAVLVIG